MKDEVNKQDSIRKKLTKANEKHSHSFQSEGKVSVDIMNLVSFESNEMFFKITNFLLFNILLLLLFYVSDVLPAHMCVCARFTHC